MMPSDEGRRPRVLLVSPPWLNPYSGSLAIATLRPILEEAGMTCDELHGAVFYPRPPLEASEHGVDIDIQRQMLNWLAYMESIASYLFAARLPPQINENQLLEALLDALLPGADAAAKEEARKNVEMVESVRRAARRELANVEIYFDRVLAYAKKLPPPDVIAFSCTFEMQLPAALVLAGILKEWYPNARTAFGGAACTAEPATELIRSFSQVDAVCYGEGEKVVVPLMRALAGEGELAAVPGIAYRDAKGQAVRTEAAPLLVDMDTLPYPQYAGFFEQFAQSEWADVSPLVMFETSRGCWWGQKHLCTFCGLNAEGLSFRRKSADRAVTEIRALYDQYPKAVALQAADNILDMQYLTSVLPRLEDLAARRDRPLRLFFEVKSNLRRDQLQQLSRAGVFSVQPGIESLDDGVLALMDKGTTAIKQVQFMKWATEMGIHLTYNIIMQNPGEAPGSNLSMAELIPYVEHMPPPSVTSMLLQRFSPYFNTPERWNIENVRPQPYYRSLYRNPSVDVRALAYQFEYDHKFLEEPEHVAARAVLRDALQHWRSLHRFGKQGPLARWRDLGTHLAIIDHRDGLQRNFVVVGSAAKALRYLDAARTRTELARTLTGIDAEVLDCQLDTWLHRRMIMRGGKDKYLGVLLRHGERSEILGRPLTEYKSEAAAHV